MNPIARRERARIAALTRSRPADDPEVAAARQRLAELTSEERTNAAIQTIVRSAPTLTREQADRLRSLLGFSG